MKGGYGDEKRKDIMTRIEKFSLKPFTKEGSLLYYTGTLQSQKRKQYLIPISNDFFNFILLLFFPFIFHNCNNFYQRLF